MTVSVTAWPAIGGSNVAWASVRYCVSPVSVITECDFIVEPPRLHTASPTNLPPLALNSDLLHMPAIIPDDILIMSCWIEWSRHTEVRVASPVRRLDEVLISQRPGFSLGKSCAAAGREAATSRTAAASGERMRCLR